MSIYRSTWWSIKVSPTWCAQTDPECTSFYRHDGVGALQISAYKNDHRAVIDDDLLEFSAGEFPEGKSTQYVRCGKFTGLGIEYVTGNSFWLKRWLRNGSLLLFVTYNSDSKDYALEMHDVNQMLNTLSPR